MSAYSLLFLQFAAIWAIWWVLIQIRKDKRAQKEARIEDAEWQEFLTRAGLIDKDEEGKAK